MGRTARALIDRESFILIMSKRFNGFADMIIIVADDDSVFVTDQHKAVLTDMAVMSSILHLLMNFVLETLRIIAYLHKALS